MTDVVIHYCHDYSKHKYAACGSAMRADHDRHTGAFDTVDCAGCLASPEFIGRRMEDVLIDLIDSGPPPDPKVLGSSSSSPKHTFTPPHRKRPR